VPGGFQPAVPPVKIVRVDTVVVARDGIKVVDPGGRTVVNVFNAITGRKLLRFRPFDRRHRNGTGVSVTQAADESSFTITARTTDRGRTFTRTFNGRTGAPIGETTVMNTSRG
jgi:hypothetical protein